MAPTYYVIELSARWLTVLLVALALVMVLAFAFGYGAAWSVLSEHQTQRPEPLPALGSEPTGTPELLEEVIQTEPTPTRQPTRPRPATATPEATPVPPATPIPQVDRADEADGFWVQVLASSSPQAIEGAQAKLVELGFPAEHQGVATSQVAGGNVLFKLRVGPFPDRESADRVVYRMRSSGFPDAWVVVP